jgi:phosphate transport system substrate-binding protein
MTRKKILFVTLLLTFLLNSCRISSTYPTQSPAIDSTSIQKNTTTPRTVDISKLNARNYPRVDGSTSAFPLQMTITCHILGVPCDWQGGDLFDPTRRIAPDPEFNGSLALIEKLYSIHHNGTHSAYMNLIEGNADIILVARRPSEDEIQAAQQANINLDVRPVALDAFVFLVHKDNLVDDISLVKIRDIYTGKITQWSDLGGIRDVIHTYQRNRNSGSQELMEALVMRGTPMIEAPDMILESMMGPINVIGDDPLGIGYSVYFYAAHIFPHENVKMIAIDSVYPASENIAARDYPLTTEVYAVIREDTSEKHEARLLLDWLLTNEGQAVVAKSGYVPLDDSQNQDQ